MAKKKKGAKKGRKKPTPEEKAKTAFRGFRYECPIYMEKGKEYDEMSELQLRKQCIEACGNLVNARDASRDHEENISTIIKYCGGCQGKECGDAVNLYRRQERIMEK